jgi:asparagine synthase (glutamine-hydrolysing)
VVTPEDRLEHQPWPAWGGRGWICFAGRLDGRSLLANALDLPTADGLPDGLLACRAVERWGEDAVRRLLGDFSLAAWHDGERRLIIAGDPMASRTIYYCRQADMVLFSTTLRGLLAMPQVSREIDERYAADFLAMNGGDDDATFYRQIRKVLPGTGLVMSADRTRTIQGHRLDPERRITLKGDRAYVEAARELLDQAVADRMRSVGPVPLSTSSGLDSSCLAVSALSCGAPVTLLTAIPQPGAPAASKPGRYNDERPLIEALVAACPGLTAEFHPPPADAAWRPDSLRYITAGGAPTRSPIQVPWFEGLYARATAMGARSIMTGAAGNHVFTWDGLRGLQTLLRQGRLLRLARELVLGSRGHPRRLAGLVKRHIVLPWLEGRTCPDELGGYSGLRREAIEEFSVFDRMHQRGNQTDFGFRGDSRRLRLHWLSRNRFWRSETLNAFRSLYGLDFTMPLGDMRLLEFCLAIPDDQFLRDGTDRYLARRLLRAAGVPAAITENRTRGYQHPEWFAHMDGMRDTLPEQIERLRRSPTARRLIDVDRLDHIVAHWPADTATAEIQQGAVKALLGAALSVGTFIAWAEGTN